MNGKDSEISNSAGDSIIYSSREGDIGHVLKSGSKFSLSYTVRTTLNNPKINNMFLDSDDSTSQKLASLPKKSASLGILSVAWKPIILSFPKGGPT